MAGFLKNRGMLLFLLLSLNLYSQPKTISIDETLTYINSKLQPKVKAEVKAGHLFLTFTNDRGEVYRKDKVALDHLDHTEIEFVEEEKMINLKCLNGAECDIRDLNTNTKVTRHYNRVNIVFDGDEKTTEGLLKAFRHLVKLVNVKSYTEHEPFE